MSLNRKLYRKILAAATALTMAFAATGCGEATSWVAKCQDETVNSGIYIFYQTEAYNEATSKLIAENSELDISDTKLLKTMAVEGKNISDWINDKAQENLKIFAAVNRKFDELGFELTEDEKNSAQYMADYYWQYYADTYEQNGIGKESFVKLVEFDSKKEKVFLHYYGEGGEKECPETEIASYLEGNYSRVKTIKFDLENTEGDETAEAKNLVVKTLAEDYRKRANSGEDFDKLVDEYKKSLEEKEAEESEEADSAEAEEEAAVTTAAEEKEEPEVTEAEEAEETDEAVTAAETEESEDADDEESSDDEESEEDEENEEETDESEDAEEEAVTTAAEKSEEPAVTEAEEEEEASDEEENSDPYRNETVYKKGSEENGYNPSEKVNNAVFNDCKVGGEAILVEDEENNCIYLIKRLEITDREDYFEGDRKNSILSEMFNDEFENTAVQWADEYGISFNAAAIRRYDPFNIKF